MTLTLPIGRTVTSPSRTTGRGAIRCTPRIATSGWLTSGVTNRPGQLAGARDGERRAAQLLRRELAFARLGRERVDVVAKLLDAPRVAAADDGNDEALLGLDGDAQVVAVEVDDLVALESRVQLGEVAQRQRRRVQDGRQEQLEVDGAEVALLDVGDGRHLAMCARQVLDDLPADATHLLAPSLARGGGGAHVLLGDPAARPARRDGGEVDAELLRDPPDERRRLDPVGHGRGSHGRGQALGVAGTGVSAGAVAPSSPITTSTDPTGATSPSPTRICSTVPAAGEGISTVVLSVWISTSGASSAISSPTATSHLATSPSVRPSPRSGSLNS